MTDTTISIFDRTLLAVRGARFAAGIREHDFLLRRAAEDITGRLETVMRDFPVAIDLGARHGVIGDRLRESDRVGTVIACDPCLPLLRLSNGPHIACEDDLLPFAAASLDLVVSGLSLHLVNDVPGALVQIRRALRPDGLFLAAVLGGRTLFELRDALACAEEEVDGGVSPRVAPFGDVRDFGALLQRAGFALPVTDADMVTVTYKTPFHLMRDIRAMGASNMLLERRRIPVKRRVLMRAAEIYSERYPAREGRIQATFEFLYLTGWAPDASQPKPLKPGSAQARLADVLGTDEIPAGEKTGPGEDKH